MQALAPRVPVAGDYCSAGGTSCGTGETGRAGTAQNEGRPQAPALPRGTGTGAGAAGTAAAGTGTVARGCRTGAALERPGPDRGAEVCRVCVDTGLTGPGPTAEL